MHILSSLDVPCAQSILDHQPEKNLVFQLTKALPEPFVDIMNLCLIEERPIGFLRLEIHTPGI
jgi:hypothetical protein